MITSLTRAQSSRARNILLKFVSRPHPNIRNRIVTIHEYAVNTSTVLQDKITVIHR